MRALALAFCAVLFIVAVASYMQRGQTTIIRKSSVAQTFKDQSRLEVDCLECKEKGRPVAP